MGAGRDLGILFGLFLGITLLSFGILPLNSPLLTFLPIIGLVLEHGRTTQVDLAK